MVQEKRWIRPLSHIDLLDILMKKNGPRVTAFSVNQRHHDGRRWRSVWRVDTAHGRLHEHLPAGGVRLLETTRSRDYSRALTQAEQQARVHWKEHLDEWRRVHG